MPPSFLEKKNIRSIMPSSKNVGKIIADDKSSTNSMKRVTIIVFIIRSKAMPIVSEGMESAIKGFTPLLVHGSIQPLKFMFEFTSIAMLEYTTKFYRLRFLAVLYIVSK